MSLDVSIFRPVDAVAVTAPFAARVSPLQVTVTGPAARLCPAPRVRVIASDAYADEIAVGGFVEHWLPMAAVTRPAGNVRRIASPAKRTEDVAKDTVAAPPDPSALLIVNADASRP